MSYAGGRTVEEIALESDFCEEERCAAMAKLPDRLKMARFPSRRAAEETAGRQ
jgi:hypothetical protein